MWARVESDTVTKIYKRPTGLTIGNISYPANIFSALDRTKPPEDGSPGAIIEIPL